MNSWKQTAFTFAAFLLVTPASSQDRPSYEETVQYIVDRTSFRNPNSNLRYALEFPERCTIKYSNVYPDMVVAHTVAAKDLDPAEVEGRNGEFRDIFLITRENREMVQWANTDGRRRTAASMHIFVHIGAEGTRVGRAFENLIRLCGGQEELF
jgi:hypothetical protein